MRITSSDPSALAAAHAAAAPRATTPFLLARAYSSGAPSLRLAAGDRVSSSAAAQPAPANPLVAATVREPVEFSSPPAASGSGADAPIPMYRHPADRNAAATLICLGRVLDAQG